MFPRIISDDDLRRLESDRDAAHRSYNEALTALDQAVQAMPDTIVPPPAYDEQTIAALNALALTVPADPLAALSGWRKRLGGFVWRFLGPSLQQQQAFNAALLEQVVHRAAAERGGFERVESAFRAVRLLQDSLVRYAQTITAYVDTKDRQGDGLVRHFADDRTVALAGALSGVSDELAKRWESMVAREQRYEARVAALSATHGQTMGQFQEFRTAVASLQQTAHALKREMAHVLEQAASPAPAGVVTTAAPTALASNPLESYKYVGFEDEFRGSAVEIRGRMTDYVAYFEGAAQVVDLGCGRGEFLALLRERGVSATGVDINHEMVERCRADGLDVVEGDGVAYLASRPDGSVGGLFAAQVVEHLQPDQLLRLLDVAYTKLRPGARIVLETINPACWAAFFDSYIRDLTHVRPVHPDTLKHLLQTSGFQGVEVCYRSPYPERDRLQTVSVPVLGDAPPRAETAFVDLAERFNLTVERLNSLLFTYMDYAAVATRG